MTMAALHRACILTVLILMAASGAQADFPPNAGCESFIRIMNPFSGDEYEQCYFIWNLAEGAREPVIIIGATGPGEEHDHCEPWYVSPDLNDWGEYHLTIHLELDGHTIASWPVTLDVAECSDAWICHDDEEGFYWCDEFGRMDRMTEGSER